jgi:adenylosuccinate synthase
MCRGYLTHDGALRRIAPGPFRDLDYQAMLTDRLTTAMPLLDPDAPTDWPAAVRAAVGAPVVLTSHGPTARDKIRQRWHVVAARPR